MNTFLSQNKLVPYPSLATLTPASFVVFDLLLTSKLPVWDTTVATSIVHSKLDYCNTLDYNLPNSQLKRLQHIQNSLARVVAINSVTPPLFSNSLHWLIEHL